MIEKEKIEKKAQEILNEYNINSAKGVDIIDLAQSMGFTIVNAGLPDSDDGFIMVKDGANEILGVSTDKLIGVNATRDLGTKRFIIAHELGHYVLSDNVSSIFAHRENKRGKDENENEVDYFAACLLMPKEAFQNQYNMLKESGKKYGSISKELEKIFNVPLKSILRRIDELQLAQ